MQCAGEYFLLACLGDSWPHQRFRLVWWEPMWTAIRKISNGLSGRYFADQYLTLSIETDTRVAIWVTELWASLVALPEQTVDSLCSIIKVLSPKSLGCMDPFFFLLSCVDLIDNWTWFRSDWYQSSSMLCWGRLYYENFSLSVIKSLDKLHLFKSIVTVFVHVLEQAPLYRLFTISSKERIKE